MPSRTMVPRWRATIRRATSRPAPPLPLPGSSCVKRVAAQRLRAPGPPRTTCRPGCRGPSRSSRTASRSPRPRPQSSALDVDGSRRPRRRPGHRCRRCSSGPRPARPSARRQRTSVSPRTALRRWPMWAALFGLMFVCSTIVLPPFGPVADPGFDRRNDRAAEQAGGERRAARNRFGSPGPSIRRLPHAGREGPGSGQLGRELAAAFGLGSWPGGGRPEKPGLPAPSGGGPRPPGRAPRRRASGSSRPDRTRALSSGDRAWAEKTLSHAYPLKGQGFCRGAGA